MRLERRRLCRVALDPPASPERLALFLSRPIRPLRGLLHPDRLHQAGPHRYDYVSRPYGVAGWTLQPHVRLEARWQEGVLHLRQLESRVEGLGVWQERLQFGLEAWLTPREVEPGVGRAACSRRLGVRPGAQPRHGAVARSHGAALPQGPASAGGGLAGVRGGCTMTLDTRPAAP